LYDKAKFEYRRYLIYLQETLVLKEKAKIFTDKIKLYNEINEE
jgi:hypothetical protein